MNQNPEIERIKKIIEDELERDFNTGRIRPASRFKHLKEHIFYKIDNSSNVGEALEKDEEF